MLSPISCPLFAAALPGVAPDAVPVAPALILILCAVAGVGTYLLLPSRKGATARLAGGGIVLLAALALGVILLRWTFGSPVGAGRVGVHNPYFWIFAAAALVGSLRVVTHRRPVYSALYFVLTVFSTAGLFVLLWAEFMAAALVLIYAGAILVAYVFVIMLAADAAPSLSADRDASLPEQLAEHDAVSREPLVAAAVGFTLMGILLYVIAARFGAPVRAGALRASAELARSLPAYPLVSGSTQELGDYLFSRQLIGLQLAAVILTLSVIGAITISRRQVLAEESASGTPEELKVGPVTSGGDDDPHNIPIYGSTDGSIKAYPES